MSLHFIKYDTMNSWNNSKAPAFNLKVYNVIPQELQSKVFELMDTQDFYWGINSLIEDFNLNHNYEWQAGFNGRSGGYLVLYKGGKNAEGRVYTQPGMSIDFEDVPTQVLKEFKQLAEDIVALTIDIAEHATIVEEKRTREYTVKVIEY